MDGWRAPRLIEEVGAVDGALEADAPEDSEHGAHVRLHSHGGSGGEGQHRDVGELLLEHSKLQVVGAEVVAPLAAAMCLVDRNPDESTIAPKALHSGYSETKLNYITKGSSHRGRCSTLSGRTNA
eukprot:5397368-Pyramimonas_sp.AAC.1